MSVAADPRPTDLAYGTVATWVYATPALSVASGLAVDFGDRGGDWRALTTTLSVAGIGGALVILVWGAPLGLMLAHLLRRSAAPLRALTFAAFGGLSGLLAALLAGGLFGERTMPAPGVSATIVGLAAALGWVTAWRRMTREPRIRRRPALPGPDAVAVLARPTWGDAWTGAVFTWLVITPALAITSAVVITWGMPWTVWGVLLVPTLIMIFTGIVSGIIVLGVGVPGGMLVGRLLAGVRSWPWHLAAYAVLGATIALGFVLMDNLLEGSLFRSMTTGWGAVALVAVSAVSVAAGWALAWRRAVLRERLRLAFLD